MDKYYNLSNPQKIIFYTEQVYKDTSISNISGTLRINAKVNFAVLEKAINKVIENNDALRMKITLNSEAEPVQSINKYKKTNIELIDVKDENSLQVLINKLVKIPFSSVDEHLFKFIMFKFPSGFGGCNIVENHIISDAWGTTLIGNQIMDFYWKILNNKECSDKKYSYLDFINSEKEYEVSKKYLEDKKYWQNKYNSLNELASISKNKESNFSCVANRQEFQLTEDESRKISEYCSKNNISEYAFFLTVYSIYISRVTFLNKITIGTPILNRRNIKEKNTIGMFVNTVPIDIDLSENLGMLNVFKNTTKEIMTTLRHSRYSYIELLKYIRKKFNVNRGLYDILISFQNAKTGSKNSEIPYTSKWDFNGYISESLNIHISDLDSTNRMNIYYDYQIDKLTNINIKNLHNRIMFIIKQIIEDENLLLHNIDIVPENEKEIINNINKNYNANYPKNKTIYNLFEDQVKKTPNNIALSINNKQMTYSELNKKSNSLANYLIKNGIKNNVAVGLRINKSFEMIIAILAIIKAGGYYVPINLSYPEERVSFMLKDCNAKMLLTNTKSNDLNFNIKTINLDNKEIYNFNTENLKIKNKIDDPLYIIYTSGSTGIPKGAVITHRNVVRLLKNDNFLFDFNENDVWTMFHSVAFDFSVWEMYGALLYGGRLVLVPEDISINPKKFLTLLRDEKVTILNQTPTFFYNLLEQEMKIEDKNLNIKYIIFGGEALKPNLIKLWHDKYPQTKLINMYGITETTVHVTYKELESKDLLSDKSNIGYPIPTLKVYILDKKQRMLPIGIEGEICVIGDGVCKGYLNKEELNKTKFIKNPYCKKEKLYRSADSAYIGDDGNLYYIDRIDNQVKIRGFRVEIGEIETKLLKHPSISKCVVLEDKKSDKDSRLVAYIVCNKKTKIEEIKEYIKKLVPAYMVPNYFVKLDEIPVNYNGKVDKKKLKSINYTIEKENKYIAPRNKFEEELQKIIQEEMNINEIGIDDDILNLGADSLTLMRIVAKLLDTGNEVSIQKFYKNKTIRNISDSLKIEKASINKLNKNVYYDFIEKEPKDKIKINNILLTGATGFLGAHLLNELIKQTKANVYCIIRNKNNVNEKTRLIEKLKFYFNNKITNEINKRIIVVEGDITKERLGLSEEEYKNIGYKIDTVIHSAAMVNHYGKEELFENVNVNGTQNIIEFCKTFKAKLNHISTISVSADFMQNQKIEEVFNEHCLYIGQNYMSNIYVKTKFEAEYNIWKESHKRIRICNLSYRKYKL